MYAVSKEHKGTNKLFAKTRRGGLSQKLDNLENQRDATIKRDNDMSNTPKPVFHVNGKKSYYQKNHQESISAQHQEIIKYIHESWKHVKKDYDNGSKHAFNSDMKNFNHRVPHVLYYKSNSAQLTDFEPFDLEAFWGQRLFQNITQST